MRAGLKETAGAQDVEGEEAGRAEQEGRRQTGDDQQKRDPFAPRRAHDPGADKQVKGQKMRPARKRDLRRFETSASHWRACRSRLRPRLQNACTRLRYTTLRISGMRSAAVASERRGVMGARSKAPQPIRARLLQIAKRVSGSIIRSSAVFCLILTAPRSAMLLIEHKNLTMSRYPGKESHD